MRICKLCNNEFKTYQSRCVARCGSCNTKIRRFRAKAAAIEFLGGKCVNCGWSGNQAAIQFHHLKGKDFTGGSLRMLINPISDSEAIVEGIGRSTGYTLTFNDNKMYFSGLKLKKIKE